MAPGAGKSVKAGAEEKAEETAKTGARSAGTLAKSGWTGSGSGSTGSKNVWTGLRSGWTGSPDAEPLPEKLQMTTQRI
jgi:hypothetical protein